MISSSKEQLQQELEYTLLKPDWHSRWISIMLCRRYSLNSEAIVMRQLRRWQRLWRRSLTCSHKRTSMGPSRSCWNGTTSALQPKEITSKGTRVSCVYYQQSAYTKKVCKLIKWSSYIEVILPFSFFVYFGLLYRSFLYHIFSLTKATSWKHTHI